MKRFKSLFQSTSLKSIEEMDDLSPTAELVEVCRAGLIP